MYNPYLPRKRQANGDGTHTHICSLCGDKQTEAHSFGADHKCSKCGALDPDFYQVNASVSKTSKKVLFVTNYTYTVKPTVKGADVKKVEYSLDGGIIWFTGTSFTLPNNNYTFRFRITDSTGHVTYFTAKNGTDVVK